MTTRTAYRHLWALCVSVVVVACVAAEEYVPSDAEFEPFLSWFDSMGGKLCLPHSGCHWLSERVEHLHRKSPQRGVEALCRHGDWCSGGACSGPWRHRSICADGAGRVRCQDAPTPVHALLATY